MWGISDTSVSFCENKYEESKYIAEFYNTISSLSYMIVAYPFLRTEIKRIAWSCMGVGMGSILLHGTGRYYGQWVDEISMLLYGHTTLRYLDKTHPNIFPLILFAYLTHWRHFYVFLVIFVSFQIKILKINWERKRKKNTILYVLFFMIGFICWGLDQMKCTSLEKYKLHAFWHISTSLSMLINMIGLLKDQHAQ